MTWLRIALSRFAALFRTGRLEEELDEELRVHLDILVDENLRQGMAPGDARYAALRSFGSVDRAKESYRDQLVARVKGLPGVETASFARYLPLSLDSDSTYIYVEGQAGARDADAPDVQSNTVWPEYFATMGIPILQGRDFTSVDNKPETRVAIVNETFARRFWPGSSALGKRLRRGGAKGPWWEIIGVARDGKYWSLGEAPQPFIYFPMRRDYNGHAALVVRTTVEPNSIIGALRREIRQLDSTLPVYDAKAMREHLRLSLYPLRTGAWVAGSFALLALALSGLGIYGVMAYTVSQRTREIGIRMALGARPAEVMALVVKQGTRLGLIGLTVGLIGALALSRLMSSVLYGVGATDLATFVSVIALLGSVVWIACYLPARRATRVDPLAALRYE